MGQSASPAIGPRTRGRPDQAQVEVFVATLDTGGISHSGREFMAVDYSVENVRQALVAVVKYHGWPPVSHWPVTEEEQTFEALNDQYGVTVVGPIPIGSGVRSDL